jgi:hypothetical protein
MMRTWVRRMAGAFTLTYLATAGERAGVWAWRVVGRVGWRVIRDRARVAMGAKRGCMSFSGGVSLPRTEMANGNKYSSLRCRYAWAVEGRERKKNRKLGKASGYRGWRVQEKV